MKVDLYQGAGAPGGLSVMVLESDGGKPAIRVAMTPMLDQDAVGVVMVLEPDQALQLERLLSTANMRLARNGR